MRVTDDEGQPIGYQRVKGVQYLSPEDRERYERLGSRFRFRDVSALMGGSSGSNPARFIEKCLNLQVIKKDGKEYLKIISPSVEHVESMEYSRDSMDSIDETTEYRYQERRPDGRGTSERFSDGVERE